MTTTKILRAMLDEREVKYTVDDSYDVHECTEWGGTNNLWWQFVVDTDEDVPYGELLLLRTGGANHLPPAQAIETTLGPRITGETSDGFHTFNELYHHRAVLFSVIVRDHKELAWKSKLHHDGTMYDGMFIVGIETPNGQATYHYDIDPYWDMFDCKELEQAPEWDGHTPADAIARIATLGRGTCYPVPIYSFDGEFTEYDCYACSECGAEWDGDTPNFCPICGARVKED